MSQLSADAVIALGKTADWVAITEDAVWVGSTGPDAVHRIDPNTNRRIARVLLSGKPCAGLAADSGSLWVPLCGAVQSLAKIDLKSNRLTTFAVGRVQAEGGIAAGAGAVWLIVDPQGTLVRIDPATGAILKTIQVPPGSFNPYFSGGQVWVTRAEGSEITRVDAASGSVVGSVPTGPHPRFLTAALKFIWTLNQGDGSVTRVDPETLETATIALHTPGHGGDISSGGGLVWTTMARVPLSGIDAHSLVVRCQWTGAGGDSLGIGFESIWLTDYFAGSVSRIPLPRAVRDCTGSEGAQPRP